MENSYTSLSVAINELIKEGYTEDFNLVEDGIESRPLKRTWEAGECDVIKYYRYEGMSNPDDNSILYVIVTHDGRKGLLVDNYSADGGNVSPEMLKKLHICHNE